MARMVFKVLEMKTTVLLIIILVKQGLNNHTVILSPCRNKTIEFILTNNNQKYQLKLCSSDSVCLESKDNITFQQSSKTKPQNALDCLEEFDFSCSQCATTTQDSSDPVLSSTTSITTTTKAQNDTSSTNSRQNILIALLVIFAVLLVIVSTGWVCTCWAMKKRRQEMNINTTNIRYSEIQVTNGNNIMSLRHNQAYGTQPEKETNNSNTDGEYEVIPPLMHEKTRLNTTEVDDDRENVNVQTSQSTTQQASPGQPKEEVEHTHEQLEQPITESSEQKDQTGNVYVYHTFESKAEDTDDDKAAPYEVPVPTPMKTKNQE